MTQLITHYKRRGTVFLYHDQSAIAMVTTAVSGILGTFVGVNIKNKNEDA